MEHGYNEYGYNEFAVVANNILPPMSSLYPCLLLYFMI